MVWQSRTATVADLDSIMAIETTVFGSDAWSRETMQSELAHPQTHYIVTFRPEVPDEIDGYAGLLAPRKSEHAEIQTIAVAKAARRNGLGRSLIDALVTEAKSRGTREVFLEVRADNPDARRLYTSIGFAPIGVRKGYYQPEGVNAIVMRLILGEPPGHLTVKE
jgi:[ribosomal protein S18]-alanine N-acetyltransferase